jgi:hypothetical protein
MGVRHWLMMVIGTALLLAACTSPGKPFAYRDLKVSLGPTSAPTQPTTTQTSTISFTLRNTWSQPVTGVKWELRDTTDELSVVVVEEDDTVAIDAFDRVVIDVALPAQSAGKRTYVVVVDPDNTQAEADETNNTSSTLTVIAADQDIAFATGASAPAIVPGSPASTSSSTLTFTLTNTVNAAQTMPVASINVPFDITLNGAAITPPFVATPSSPAAVNANSTTPVSVVLPPTNSAGTFVYTISLWPNGNSNGDDSNTSNNSVSVTLVIPAGG